MLYDERAFRLNTVMTPLTASGIMQVMSPRPRFVWVLVLVALVSWILADPATASSPERVWRVQIPYEPPPKAQATPDVAVPPNTGPLTEAELERAEALLPLLEGKQEFWAMGEFVHLGEAVVPVLVKALAMPGPRIRFNAIETLSMMKAKTAVPALLEAARQVNEMSRIREHALRVAVRLDPAQTVAAIQAMTKDTNSTIRKTAAFEARYVRHKEVIPPLIDLLIDDERFVAISALQSLWILSRHETEFHDWENSSKQDRIEWSREWVDWWATVRDSFEVPEVNAKRRPL